MAVGRPAVLAPVVFVALVALAGCTGDPAPDPTIGTSTSAPAPEGVGEESTSENPTTDEPASGDPPPALDVADAAPAGEGEHYDVVVTWPGGGPEAGSRRPWVLLPDGSAIGVEEPPGHLVGDVFTAPARVGVMSGDTFTPFGDTSGILPERGFRGVGEVAHADGVTVWLESPSIQGWGAWRLFVHDDAGTRLLTTEEDVAARFPDVVDGGVWHLRVQDGRVSWSGADAAVSVAVDGTDLRSDPPPDAAAPGDVEVVTRADGGSDLLVTGPDGPVVIHEDGPVAGDVVVCGNLIAWLRGREAEDGVGSLRVFDRATGALWHLGDANPWGTIGCAGDLLSYGRAGTGQFADTLVIRWSG